MAANAKKTARVAADPAGVNFDFMSDMHADRWPAGYDYAAHKKNDIAVIAGDLQTGTAQALAELKKIAAVYKTVLYVDGNHEYRTGTADYAYNFDFAAVQKALREGIAKIPNVVYLRDQTFVKDGVAFIGANGHWDYKFIDGVSEEDAIQTAAKNFKTTFNEAASFSKLAREDYYNLRDRIIALNKDPAIREIVVVTHTVPRPELLGAMDKFPLAWEARMGSGKMRHVLKYDTHKKVKLWLFGHTHAKKQAVLDGVLYHENPRGRGDEGNKDYKPSTFSIPASVPQVKTPPQKLYGVKNEAPSRS